jgi:hypothetical protein
VTTCREVSGLLTVAPAANPWPKTRLRGVRHQGILYQRAVSRALPGAQTDVWFQFHDSNGSGMCGLDFLIDFGTFFAVLEAKLTDNPEARRQLSLLYRPVVEFWAKKPAIGVVVCKNVTQASTNIHHSLATAVRGAEGPRISVLHWRGKGPIA